MAKHYRLSMQSHDSIYTNAPENKVGYNRKVDVFYSLPQNGTNENTGILLLLAGFGGSANSNVYQQMREEFADKYNLVTVQCNYFGYEFMKDYADKMPIRYMTRENFSPFLLEEELNFIFPNNQFSVDNHDFFLKNNKRDLTITLNIESEETPQNFNDMGFMQAIDNINAVLNVLNLLYNNNYPFNTKKILTYGFSHGAYLSYMCNAFAPKLFSLIIDNSAWLYPKYIKANRGMSCKINDKTEIVILIHSLANKMFANPSAKIFSNMDILNLNHLYDNFTNESRIIVYHGIDDKLITASKKRGFCEKLNNCTYNEIDTSKVDDNIFKSTNHGLNADFKKLFDLTMKNIDFDFNKSDELEFVDEVIFETDKAIYKIDYQNIFPKIYIY